ncbi:hypothetical protein MMC26_004799 [Xylographa opegraphella]|nr:hypothetical protein [Xylographa opegraphella]
MAFERSVLITGTSSGSVGSALAASFAAHGFTVFAGLRSVSKIDPSLSILPNVHVLTLDVASEDSIAAAFEFVASKTKGSLDCLVNNAGSTYTSPLMDTNMETARKMFDVNFWGVLSMTKAFVPLLENSRGTVVNVSSVGAIVHTPYLGIYSASKSALTIASETLRLELAPFNINVITAMLGVVKSNLHVNSAEYSLPPDSMYKPVEKNINDSDLGKDVPKAMEAEVFANRLVKDILNGKKGLVWRGNMAHVVKWTKSLLPAGVFDGLITKGRGLDQMAKTHSMN